MSDEICPHFGECGGCTSQGIPYEEQLKAKAERVAAAFSGAGLALAPAVRPAPALWRYRNKMEFAFGDVFPPEEGGPWLRLGFKARKRWNKVVDVGSCLLASEEAAALLASVRVWAAKERLEPYNSVRKKGFLRHLVLREAKNTPERMVMLVTNSGEIPEGSFLRALEPGKVTTALWGVNAKVADTAECDARKVLSGSGFITEVLRFPSSAGPGRSLRFRISPQSFFQTNTLAAELLYGKVRLWVMDLAPERLTDLYCGGGGIGLSAADLCKELTGVESNPLGVLDAKANAALNAVSNSRFIQGLSEDVLAMLPPSDVLIVDPPRPGLHPKLISAVLSNPAPFLIYVSCNPEALSSNLKALGQAYEVAEAEAFDLFPHTPHVETAVLLRRRG
ncbi:MAG: 23S rRNA (uracil(1939)-C(5))-methyltransferase RlmD [Elusimicrobia bacterium]|nr:23S rRNA (uracil(1939)-C(5))-methyltransferase RlmD [Elusimicrobiota bacterium]